MTTTRLTIRLAKDLRRRLDRLARQRAKRPSELAREALEAYCQTQENGLTCYDIAQSAGVIGIAKNLPADLSTNPKYMEGFGKS